MTDAEAALAAQNGAVYWRTLPDGMAVFVVPMLGGKARLGYGDEYFIEDGYCYESPARALEAALVWNGEGDPLDGWHRHLKSGRRRENGDPTKEKVLW